MNNRNRKLNMQLLTLVTLGMGQAISPEIGFGQLTRGKVILSENDAIFIETLDRGGREIWIRRFRSGLSLSEREFVNQRIHELMEDTPTKEEGV